MKTTKQSLIADTDERFACSLRQRYGLRGWLVSWYRQPSGRWLARLSCPEYPDTIERHGRSRIEAIHHADNALRRLTTAIR